MVRPGHCQDVLAQPAYQQGHVLGQSHGAGFRRPRVPQLPGHVGRLAAVPPLVLRLLPLQLGTGGDGLIRPVFQVRHQRHGLVEHVEDVAAAGNLGQHLRLGGPQAPGKVRDGRLRLEAAVD